MIPQRARPCWTIGTATVLLPGDPTYLLDMLHGFDSGRLRIVEGQVQPAKVVISVAEAMDMPTAAKPVAGGWLGKRA